jgi:DNA polymerase-3 subunit delta
MHATDFLSRHAAHPVPPLVVLHGSEPHLKESSRRALCRLVLGTDDERDLGMTRFNGPGVEWKQVRDELLTVSMFGERRLVVVDDADEFVSAHRAALEHYADKSARQAVLVLDVKSWRKTTRLAKRVDAAGLELDCSELAGAQLQRWLVEHAQARYGKQLARDAATLMTELAGSGMGLLDQELAKLTAYVGDRARIGLDDVRALVGGWRAETTWKMTDAIRDASPAAALRALEKLLTAGEPAPKILGGLNYVFRKYARATELSRRGTPLRAALQQAGVFPRDIDSTERYLRRIGRQRAEYIVALLLQADNGLKGGSRLSERLQLEQLLLRLCGCVPL